MTTPRDPDSIVATWLEEGPNQLPETTRRAIAVAARSTRQARPAIGVPWRTNQMNPFARLAVAATAIVIVAGGALMLLSPGNTGVGGPAPGASPTPSVDPAASSSPDASDVPNPTPGVFSSARYGYSVAYPAGIHTAPSEQDWPAGFVASPSSSFLDSFTGKLDTLSPLSATTYFTGIASQPLPQGMSEGDWMAGHIQRNWQTFGTECGGRPEAWIDTSVAGAPGRQVQTDCLAGPASVTEIVFTSGGYGWIITGDTPLVEVLRASFELPS